MGKLFGTDGIRGVANETLTCHLAYRVGQAAAISLGSTSGRRPRVVIGKDTRISSDMLEAALLAGLTASGCDAIRLGVIPTPAVAYLTVQQGADAGIVISASHNPYEHNGIKMFSSKGFKLSDELEAEMEALILQEGELPTKTHGEIGRIADGAALAETYLAHLASTVEEIRPLRVVFDCANGAASATAEKLFSRFPLQAKYLSVSPDGVNINEACGSTHLGRLCQAVREGGFDLGLAFDGDADRCFVIDENGEPVTPSAVTALVAEREIARAKAEGNEEPVIIYNLITSKAVPELVEKLGGRAVKTRVGHSFIKAVMAEENGVFGGEHSAHYYFKDFFNADTGMLAAMHVLAALGGGDQPLSEISAKYSPYVASGEINSEIEDKAAAVDRVRAHYANAPVVVEDSDGTTFTNTEEGWWVNLRPSNTEPFLRLNLEAPDVATMERVRDEVLALVRQG